MSDEPSKITQPVTTISNPNTLSTPSSLSLSRPISSMNRYSSYGGLGGGYGSMGAMGGMGGYSSMGMGRMGRGAAQPNPQQPDYRSFFFGIQTLMQMIYSGVGFFMFTKIFSKMMVKMVKFICNKTLKGIKLAFATLFLNRVSTRVLDGVFRSHKNGSSGAATISLCARALASVCLLGISVVWFLNGSNKQDEEAEEIMSRLKERKRRRQEELRKLNENCWRSAMEGFPIEEKILEEAYENAEFKEENAEQQLGEFSGFGGKNSETKEDEKEEVQNFIKENSESSENLKEKNLEKEQEEKIKKAGEEQYKKVQSFLKSSREFWGSSYGENYYKKDEDKIDETHSAEELENPVVDKELQDLIEQKKNKYGEYKTPEVRVADRKELQIEIKEAWPMLSVPEDGKDIPEEPKIVNEEVKEVERPKKPWEI